MDRPATSIIIRTYNESRFLPSLLDAIKKQRYPDYETIVVDSGSIDGTVDIANQFADRVIPIRSDNFTFGYSLNVGIKAAYGQFIVIVSAHTLPADENWLASLVQPLQNARTAMVYGRQLGGPTSKFSESRDMQRTFGVQRRVLKPPNFFANNANSAIRKDLWDKHPFDETLLGLEDIEWAKHWMQRDYQVAYEPQAALYHIHDESWWQVRRRYYREAVAARRIGVKDWRHALVTPFKESMRTAADIGHLVLASDSRSPANARRREKIVETLAFRYNKAVGTFKGLVENTVDQSDKAKKEILFDRSGKAVVIHGSRKASLETVAIPDINPGDVLIRVAYVAVCATDLEIFKGTLGYYQDGTAQYPITPGHEFCGKIAAFGTNVEHLQIGDAVVVECIQSCGECEDCKRENFLGCRQRTELGVIGRNGGYAEYVTVPGKFVHRLPADIDLPAACLCEPLAVAIKGMKRLRRTWRRKEKNQPKSCAVVGAGPIGHLCARVLAHWGHKVTVFDRSAPRLRYFADSGIETSQDIGAIDRFDNIIEATGSPDALHEILLNSRAGTSILLLGLPYAHRNFTFESIVAYDKIIIGSVGSAAKHFERAIELLPHLDTRAFTQKILPLSEFKEAWRIAESQQYLKVIIEAR
ncbi:MAG: alcohol dehydrogenase catalytic domain-containing protein [Desulfobacterales bacterium]|nr:alcohol dehydrogenase catalytic domain-containing protein [Desulfobacterales bacterium]